MILELIGFIILILIGCCCLFGFFAAATFGSGSEAIGSLVVAVLVFWTAFHFAPFHITFTGG